MQIAIIGLGLIGGSLAKALKENTEHTVIGFDRDENTCSTHFPSAPSIPSAARLCSKTRTSCTSVCIPQMSCASSRKTHRILKKVALSRMCAASKIRSAAN